MLPRTNGGMSVHLTRGTTELFWLGAGDFYKYISGFLSEGNSDMPFNQPWDNNWHSFAYKSDGKMLSLWHNGSKCGEAALPGTPDKISFQSIGMDLRVRNVRIEKLPLLSTPSVNIPFFVENFTSPKFIDRWNGSNNGGSVTIGDNGLKLEGNGKGYPILISQSSPFPSSGNWTASFGYHYSSIGNYGTEIRCDRSDGNAVLLVHQDVHGQYLTLNGKTVWQSLPGVQWHVVSLVEKDDQYVVYIDGNQVGKDTAKNKPLSFHIGGGMLNNPWDWNNLEIAFVKVNIGAHPLNQSALNERTTLLSPLTRSTLVVSPNPEATPTSPVETVASVADIALAKINKQVDDHNDLVKEGNRLEDLKSQYQLAYKQCELAKMIADNSGQEGRYYQALRGMVQFSNAYDFACSQSDIVWRQAALLRSIIEANPLYTPIPQTKSTDVTVTVIIHSGN